MSISENIGGLSNYFSRIWASKIYKGIKEDSNYIKIGCSAPQGVVPAPIITDVLYCVAYYANIRISC